jgi:hypothetical protein
MTVKTVVAIGSLGAALASAGCLSFYEIPVEIPIQSKIDVTSFQRVLIAGFVTGGTTSIDPNTETARLLRSQLRSKQDLRVIDSDVMALNEEADRRQASTPTPPPVPAPASAQSDAAAEDADLARYERIFADTVFWKELGQQYEAPLIVTGSVLFTEVSKSGVVSRPQSFTDPRSGVEEYQSVRQFSDMKGYALTPKFIFIDGRTGAQLYSETYHEETLYPAGQNTPALSSYFELMDKLLPSFLNTLSNQKIRGSRVLLK